MNRNHSKPTQKSLIGAQRDGPLSNVPLFLIGVARVEALDCPLYILVHLPKLWPILQMTVITFVALPAGVGRRSNPRCPFLHSTIVEMKQEYFRTRKYA